MTDLVIVGTGGLAREVHELVEDLVADGADWNLIGFVDDDPSIANGTVHDLAVLGTSKWLAEQTAVDVVIAIGATASRRVLSETLAPAGHRFPTLVHPAAAIGRRCRLGEGDIICAGNHLTTDLIIGNHVIVYPLCTITHDDRIDSFVTLAPGVHVSGNVHIGEGCDIGAGAVVIQGVSIGHWSVIGAGSVVVRDLPANCTAVGSPAKPIKERHEGWYLS